MEMRLGSKMRRKEVPKYTLPDTPLPANVVKTLIEDEMCLDANPRQNLASFVTVSGGGRRRRRSLLV